jgi:hypothetical protein
VGGCEWCHGYFVYAVSHSIVVSAGSGRFLGGQFVGHFLYSLYGLYDVSHEILVDLHYHACRTELFIWVFYNLISLIKADWFGNVNEPLQIKVWSVFKFYVLF